MTSPSDSERQEKLEENVSNLIKKKLDDIPALIGITIGSHGGTVVASEFKKEANLTNAEIAAAASSLLFLSSKMLKGTLNQKTSHNLIAGKETYLLSMMTDLITMTIYLNRELTELDGLTDTIAKFKEFALEISAIIETSDLLKEEIFGAVKRAIPNALVIAIITNDGLPIKIQSTMPEPMLSAMISAIYNLADILLDSSMEYSITFGTNGSIIIHKLDSQRILCVAVPESDDSKVGSYIVKIRAIINEPAEQ